MMYARVGRFDGINVAAAEATMGQAEEVLRPTMEALDGYAGHLELIGADGNGISVTFFDTQQNAEAAEPTFDQEIPKKLGDVFKEWEGRRVEAQRLQGRRRRATLAATDEKPRSVVKASTGSEVDYGWR
jgi:hypothetical protein